MFHSHCLVVYALINPRKNVQFQVDFVTQNSHSDFTLWSILPPSPSPTNLPSHPLSETRSHPLHFHPLPIPHSHCSHFWILSKFSAEMCFWNVIVCLIPTPPSPPHSGKCTHHNVRSYPSDSRLEFATPSRVRTFAVCLL